MPSVMLIDDDAGVRRSLARVLREEGFDVEAYASAEAFLAREPAASDGCLVLDVEMPGLGGLALQHRLRELGESLPIVFLTGHGDVGTSVDAMKLGAVDFLEKPVGAEKLVAAIRTALARDATERAKDFELRGIEARIARLSAREREVMGHVVAGRLNKQIAADLNISLKTVKAHRAKVMSKMDAHSVPALVDLCRAAGIDDHQ